ncbi:exo-beta-N-acetylmuramidase NamZ domain-containing protein [Bacteroidota bacterium]
MHLTNKLMYLFLIVFITVSTLNLYSQIKPLTKPGIDNLVESDFEILKGKNIVLLTNHAGRTSSGELTVEAFLNTDVCRIIAVMAPEHGFYTTVPAGKHVKDDNIFGLPVYSLYGKNRKPVFSQLEECNAVVIDIQEIGVRSYTYISTVFRTMQSCAEYNLPVYILDRPNPLGGLIVDGNIVDKGKESFVGIIPVSYIHGCTIGELARMINGEGWLSKDKDVNDKCDLTVIKMKNWERRMQWEDTGLNWYPTSPHVPTVNAVRGIAMQGIFGELGIISIGIGTTLPFQYIGSPDLDIKAVEKELGTLSMHGVTLNPVKYQPFYGMYSGKQCKGFLFTFPIDNLFAPYSTGIRLYAALNKIYPSMFKTKSIPGKAQLMFSKVTGTDDILDAFINKKSTEEILLIARKGLDDFMLIREKYLLYK